MSNERGRFTVDVAWSHFELNIQVLREAYAEQYKAGTRELVPDDGETEVKLYRIEYRDKALERANRIGELYFALTGEAIKS